MAKQDITTSFRVDISDLKRNITEANRQIQLANSAFREASSAMDDWDSSTAGVEAKLKQLNSILEQQKAKLSSYYEQQKRLNAAAEENGKRADELRAKLKELQAQGVDPTSNAYKTLQKALKNCEKEQIANQAAAEKLDSTIGNQKATINGIVKDTDKYNAQLAKMSTSTAATVADMSEFEQELKDADKAIADADKQFKYTTASMDNWKDSVEGVSAKVRSLEDILTQQKKKLGVYDDQLHALNDAYYANEEKINQIKSAMQDLTDKGISPTSLEYKKLESALERCTEEQQRQYEAGNKGVDNYNDQLIAIKNTQRQIDNYKNTLSQLEQAQLDAAKAANRQKSAYENLDELIARQEEDLEVLKNRYADLVVQQKESSSEAEDLKRAISDLSSELKENKDRLSAADSAADDYDNSLDDLADSSENAERSLDKLNDGFTVMKGVLANLVTDGIRRAADGLKTFISDSVNLASDLYEVQNVVDVTFEKSASAIDEFAESAGNAYGMTKLAAKQYTGTLGALIKSTGVADEHLVEMSTNLVAMAGDFASFYNLDHSEAFEKIRAGIAGETEPLRQLGINMTVANMETYALQQGLKKTWSEMSYAEQTMLRYNYIMDKGSLAAGDFVRTQDSLANQMRLAQLNVDNLKIAIGERLSPVVNGAVTTFNSWMKTLDMDAVAEKVEDALDLIINGFEWFVDNKDMVIGAVKMLIGAFAVNKVLTFGAGMVELGQKIVTVATTGKALVPIIEGMTAAQTAGTIATNAGTVATNLFNAAWKANPLGIATIAIVGVSTALIALAEHLTETDAETQKVVDATNKLKQEYERTTAEIEANDQARKENMDSANAEAGTLDYLMKKLDALAGVENKSNDQKAEMQRLVDQLNEKLPELQLEYDKEKDSLNKSTDAIRDNIQAQKDLILAKAAESNLTSIAEDIAAADLKRSEAVKQLKANTDEYSKSVSENGAIYEEYQKLLRTNPASADDFYWANRKVIDSQSALYQAVKDSKDVVQGYEDEIKELNTTYENTGNLADEYIQKADISGKLAELTPKLEAAGRQMPQSIADGINAGIYAVPESIDQLNQLILFDNAIEKAGLAGKDIPQYLSQGIMNGSIDISKAVKDLDELLKLPDKATEMYNQGMVIPKGLADGINAGQYTLEEAKAIVDNALNWDDIVAKAKKKGAIIPTNLADSIREGSITVQEANTILQDSIKFDKLTKAAKDAGVEVPKNLAQEIQNGSLTPSTAIETVNSLLLMKYQEMFVDAGLSGQAIPKAISDGIYSGEMTVESATNAMNSWIKFQSAIQKSNSAGYEIPEKIANGIVSGKTSVDSAVTQMNNWIKFQKALDDAGLSGLGVSDKLAKGILSGKTDADDAVKQINKTIKTELDKGVEDFGITGDEALDGYLKGLGDTGLAGMTAEQLIKAAIAAAKEAQDSNSPSKVYEGLGKDAGAGYALGIQESEGTVSKAISGMIDSSFSGSNGLVNNMKKLGQSAGKSYASGISSTSAQTKKAGTTLKNALSKAATSTLKAVGKKAGTTFASGVSSTKGSASSAGKTLKNAVTKGATGSLLSVGKKAGNTFASGITSTKGKATNAGTTLKKAVTNAAKTDISSLGKKAGDGFVKGINSFKNKATSAGKSLKDSARSGASGGYDGMYTQGKNAAEGFRKGILSKAQSIANAAASVVKKAISAAKQAQKSASPSKIWKNEIGAMAGEGYIVGLGNMIRPAVSEAKALVNQSISAAQSELSKRNLGTVSGAKNSVLGLMGGSRQTASGYGNTTNTSSNVTNFTQIINAPKSPSRIELYRQTRNLLNYAKGV